MASIGSTPSLVVGVGVGAALSTALEPALEVPKQKAWADAPNRLPDLGLIAELVAGGKVTLDDGRAMAKRLGFDKGPFDSIVWLAQNRLDFPAMLRLWRLFPGYTTASGKSIEALLDETLAHERLDWDYRELLGKMQYAERPGIGDIAYSVVRGYLPTNIPLPVAPPATSTKVKRFPQSTKLAETWAQEIGYDTDALELMIARSGLSLAPIFAANAYFRGLLADDDYHLAIAEGDLRTEWADVLRDAARAIPSPGEFAELALRGWMTLAEAEDGGALHGMTPGHVDRLYQLKRRPLPVHTIAQAEARGGVFDPSNAPRPDPYDSSVHEANLGPEWYDLAKAMKFAPPSLFVIRTLLKDGAYTQEHAALRIRQLGIYPEDADLIAAHYAPTGAAAADQHLTKAQTTAWTKAQASYIAEESTATDVQPIFGLLGIPAAAQTEITNTWDAIRALVRKQLTPAQIKKAWSEGAINPATNQPWTEAEALAALLARGYSDADARVLLEL